MYLFPIVGLSNICYTVIDEIMECIFWRFPYSFNLRSKRVRSSSSLALVNRLVNSVLLSVCTHSIGIGKA